MTPQQAASAWQKRQAQALKQAYVQGWHTGQRNYGAPQQATPAQPPVAPMQQALAPALTSLAGMGAAVATLVPTAAQIATAGSLPAALLLAIRSYLKTNAWRLAAGASAAWAGEQHGYVQAADAAGLSLHWQLDPAVEHHCADCPALAGLPPMPLSMWPTLPGDGATACSVGCKCSMHAVAAPHPALTPAQHEVIARVSAHHPILLAA